jgi:hypothetical protein
MDESLPARPGIACLFMQNFGLLSAPKTFFFPLFLCVNVPVYRVGERLIYQPWIRG